MKPIFELGLRNLLRQKRKNLLLGSAIAFGTLTLVVATSFVNGITDTLFNRVIVYMTGHIELHMAERGSQFYSVHRDQARIEKIIRQNVTGIKSINESVTAFTRGIGNGKSDNVLLIGVNADPEFLSQFTCLSGSINAFTKPTVENPIILSEAKAKYLKLKVNDPLRIRLRTINGQQQTAVMNVVAIVKSTNMFLDMATYVRLQDLKEVMGYRPYETGGLQIILDHPETASEQADHLHDALIAAPAWIEGTLESAKVTVVGIKRDEASREKLGKLIKVLGRSTATFSKSDVLVSQPFAEAHHLRVGDPVTIAYPSRMEADPGTLAVTITGIYEPIGEDIPTTVILTHEDRLLESYYERLPKIGATVPVSGALASIVVPEWTLLPRTHTSDEYTKKNQELGRLKLKNAVLDVRSMYETASMILTFDGALRIITYSAVVILFVIILIGIINSLRMTVRERTKEIGTMRAIGMQRRDILYLFVLESFFLAIFAGLSGVIIAFILMGIGSAITIQTTTPLGIFLFNHHLVFVPKVGSIIGNLLFIVGLTVGASFFPALTASKLECADALRHSD